VKLANHKWFSIFTCPYSHFVLNGFLRCAATAAAGKIALQREEKNE
jgi:hypothetical protein